MKKTERKNKIKHLVEVIAKVYKGVIAVHENNSLPYPGCCSWKGCLYQIEINSDMCKEYDLPAEYVVRHEIMHILRGDVDVISKTENIDKRIYNYASDAIINTELKINHPTAITLEKVGWDAGYIPGVIELCSFLQEQIPEAYEMDVIPVENATAEEIEKMKKARVRVVIETAKSQSKLLEEMKKIAGKEFQGAREAGVGKGDMTINIPEASPLAELCRYLEKNGHFRGKERIIKRRFRDRNNTDVIFQYPIPLPSLKLGVVVDVSGSMTGYYERILAVARWLFERYKGVFIVFSDHAKMYNYLPSSIEDAGGGTRLISINPYIQDLDTLVIFSDFYLDADGSDKMIEEFQKKNGKVIAVSVGREPEWDNAIVYRLEEEQ